MQVQLTLNNIGVPYSTVLDYSCCENHVAGEAFITTSVADSVVTLRSTSSWYFDLWVGESTAAYITIQQLS